MAFGVVAAGLLQGGHRVGAGRLTACQSDSDRPVDRATAKARVSRFAATKTSRQG